MLPEEAHDPLLHVHAVAQPARLVALVWEHESVVLLARADERRRQARRVAEMHVLVAPAPPVDQHELAVLASKFRNLHLWGCWWYCNNPSLVTSITNLRLELQVKSPGGDRWNGEPTAPPTAKADDKEDKDEV